MSLYEGRNEIPYNNSGAKCLLENWVEERATAFLEPINVNSDYTSSAQIHRHGHKGLLTLDMNAKGENLTTVRESYVPPKYPGFRTKGKKQELLERMLFNKIGEETHKEFNQSDQPPAEFISIKQQDYDKPDFKSTYPPPTKDHNVNTEQCITFWSTHHSKIHGVSQVKTRDTPFKKNAAFSTPIAEYLDQTVPYDNEAYPNM